MLSFVSTVLFHLLLSLTAGFLNQANLPPAFTETLMVHPRFLFIALSHLCSQAFGISYLGLNPNELVVSFAGATAYVDVTLVASDAQFLLSQHANGGGMILPVVCFCRS